MQDFTLLQPKFTPTFLFRTRHARLWPHLLLFSCLITCTACSKYPENTEQAKSEQMSVYSLSQEFGNNLIKIKTQGSQADKNELVLGMREALLSSQSGMTQNEVDQFITALQKVITESAVAVEPARSGKFKDDYAKLNAERPGVTVTASGVQYEVLQAGHGKQPGPTDTVRVKYVGKLSNGIEFDGTDKDGKPVPLKINEVIIPGLKEALLLMHEGDKLRVVIPPKMGFVNFGNNRLRRRDLIYDIELVKVESPAK